jgi:hypothetical protein
VLWKEKIVKRLEKVKGDKTVKDFIEELRKQGKDVYSYGKFCAVVYGGNVTLTEKFLNLLRELGFTEEEIQDIVVDAIKHRYGLKESKKEIRKALEEANSVDPNQFIRENIAALRRFFDSGQLHRMKTERKKMRISAAMRIYKALGRRALPVVFKLTLPNDYVKLLKT